MAVQPLLNTKKHQINWEPGWGGVGVCVWVVVVVKESVANRRAKRKTGLSRRHMHKTVQDTLN